MFLNKTVDKKHDLRTFCRWSNLLRCTRFWGDQSDQKFAVGWPQLILRAGLYSVQRDHSWVLGWVLEMGTAPSPLPGEVGGPASRQTPHGGRLQRIFATAADRKRLQWFGSIPKFSCDKTGGGARGPCPWTRTDKNRQEMTILTIANNVNTTNNFIV